MNNKTRLEHPNGAVQGVCSAAIGLLALLIAFIGYTGFSGGGAGGAWRTGDLWHLGLSLIAAALLATVPWLATQPRLSENLGLSVERARKCFALGAFCTIAAIATFLIRDFTRNHAW